MHKYLSLAAIDTTTYIIDIILGCDKETTYRRNINIIQRLTGLMF